MVVCSVCKDGSAKNNLVITCKRCSVNVHPLCYGSFSDANEWKCSPCLATNSTFISCILCHQKHGAFKNTTCKKWIHVVCAIFANNIRIIDENTIDTSKLRETNLHKICVFCYSTKGVATKCAHEKCKNFLHVTCGQANQSLNVEIDKFNVSFNAYCKEHKPPNPSAGLISKYIQTSVYKKDNESHAEQPDGSIIGRTILKHHFYDLE